MPTPPNELGDEIPNDCVDDPDAGALSPAAPARASASVLSRRPQWLWLGTLLLGAGALSYWMSGPSRRGAEALTRRKPSEVGLQPSAAQAERAESRASSAQAKGSVEPTPQSPRTAGQAGAPASEQATILREPPADPVQPAAAVADGAGAVAPITAGRSSWPAMRPRRGTARASAPLPSPTQVPGASESDADPARTTMAAGLVPPVTDFGGRR